MLCRARLVETSQTIVVGSIEKCLPWAYLFFSVVHFFFKAASVKNFTCMNLDRLSCFFFFSFFVPIGVRRSDIFCNTWSRFAHK